MKLTNQELFSRFDTIYHMENPFDVQMALKEFKKEYRNSEYFTATRMGLKRAYKEFIKYKVIDIIKTANTLLSGDAIIGKINYIMENINMEYLQAALNRLISTFNIKEAVNLQGELNSTIKKFSK